MPEFRLLHTQEFRIQTLEFPILATGNLQWLGDGFYFWEDIELARWWGEEKKCKRSRYRFYSVFRATIVVTDDEFIDTVFNEDDYRNFVSIIEDWARRFQRRFKERPSLEQFNNFVSDHNIWGDIKLIRFQDIPTNNLFVEVNGFFYKKRIQFVARTPDAIKKFEHADDYDCPPSSL